MGCGAMCLVDAAVKNAATVESVVSVERSAMVPETQVPAGTYVQMQKAAPKHVQAGAARLRVWCYVLG